MEWKERPSDVAVHTTPEERVIDRGRPHIGIGDLDELPLGGKFEQISLDERERAALVAAPPDRHPAGACRVRDRPPNPTDPC